MLSALRMSESNQLAAVESKKICDLGTHRLNAPPQGSGWFGFRPVFWSGGGCEQ